MILGIRPSQILNLTGPELFLFEVDYRLVLQALSETKGESGEAEDVKLAKMKEWKETRLK